MILRERAAARAAQILGVSTQSVMSEVGKLSVKTRTEEVTRANREIEKQESILPQSQIGETASKEELALVCLLASLGDQYQTFVKTFNEKPLITDFTMGSMRTIVKEILPILEENKLDANRLLMAGDNLMLNRRPARDTLSEALMSVKSGKNADELMRTILDYIYRVRQTIYTKQKAELAKRLDVMPDGPDREATEQALRDTIKYLKYLKEKMRKR